MALPRTVVIMTALTVESKAVQAHLNGLHEENCKGTVYAVGTFLRSDGSSLRVAVATIGKGNRRAAFETERAIEFFHPEVVLFVGVAGGLKDVQIGDVVAADKLYCYESGKCKIEFEPRPDGGNCSHKLIQRATAEVIRRTWQSRLNGHAAGRCPNAYVAPIAAGEKVIAAKRSSVHRFIRQFYGDALAVEMEGRGFLEAIHANPRVSALVVRGISDVDGG